MDDNQNTNRGVTILPATIQAGGMTVPRRQLRVAAYCRVSTNDEEQLTSYEAQKNYYTDKIITNPQWSLIGIFADEGISGLSAKKRPQFLKMIRMCRKQKIDLILTKSISRFARNTVDCLNYVRMLKGLNIGVIFEKENINTLTSESEILITMLGGFAQAESESISQNVKWGRRQAMKEGKVSFQFERIYGYERGENNEPQIVPEQAEIVRRIFQSYLDGKSIVAIRQMLKDDHIHTGSGKDEWSISVLQYMLKNEKYCGDVLMQKTFVQDCLSKKLVPNDGQLPKYLIKNHHEAIISRELFELVQTEMARRTALRRSIGKAEQVQQSRYNGKYVLTGKVICGECGSEYKRVTWARNGRKKIVWRCINRLNYGTKYCSHSPTAEEGKLQTAILHAIALRAQEGTLPTRIPAVHVQSRPGSAQSEEINILFAGQVGRLQNSIIELVHTEAAGENISDSQNRLQMLLEEAATLKDQIDLFSNQMNVEVAAELIHWPREFETWDENVIRQLVDSVQIISTEKISVTFKDQTKSEAVL